MLTITNDVYQSTLISSLSGVRHGISHRGLGDARKQTARASILDRVGLSDTRFREIHQVHGSYVHTATSTKSTITDADGLVTGETGLVIGIKTADCVPVLFMDPGSRIVAAAHAGWKGTLANISAVTVKRMIELGAKSDRIRAVIGPHIGPCCYSVSDERARMFMDRFGPSSGVASMARQSTIDIGLANRLQLIETGLNPQHIDDGDICTSCRVAEFYSYRKDTKETFGEMVSFISLV